MCMDSMILIGSSICLLAQSMVSTLLEGSQAVYILDLQLGNVWT